MDSDGNGLPRNKHGQVTCEDERVLLCVRVRSGLAVLQFLNTLVVRANALSHHPKVGQNVTIEGQKKVAVIAISLTQPRQKVIS